MPTEWPWLRFFADKRIVLASGSPRRREILTDMGLTFEVVTTLKPDENNPLAYKTTDEYVLDTASMKAQEVFERCREDPSLPNADIVIGADTVVVIDGHVLEKPRDEAHALAMLSKLSGRTHQVLTGVRILVSKPKEEGYESRGFVETTNVTFSNIDNDTLKAYIDSGEPFDKAGGYGIQGDASMFVRGIEGDYWNVVGLPKHRLYQELKALSEV